MNTFDFVIAIVLITGVASLLRHRMGLRYLGERPVSEDSQETLRLRDEVKQLKDRIQVLERITVEKENSVARQIEELRDR